MIPVAILALVECAIVLTSANNSNVQEPLEDSIHKLANYSFNSHIKVRHTSPRLRLSKESDHSPQVYLIDGDCTGDSCPPRASRTSSKELSEFINLRSNQLAASYRVAYLRGPVNRLDGYSYDYDDQGKGSFTIFLGRQGPQHDTLQQLIDENKTSGGVLLVDFFATWCGPCSTMQRHLDLVKDNYRDGKVVIVKVDVDQNQDEAANYSIRALPTLILFVRGKIFKRVTGLVDVETLINAIDEALDSI